MNSGILPFYVDICDPNSPDLKNPHFKINKGL